MENNNIVKKKKSLTKQKIESLEKQVQELTKSLKNEENAKLLALADLDNMRKRFVKEKDLIEFKTTEKVIDPFLKVFEHFSIAMEAINFDTSAEVIKQGLTIILSQFNASFDKLNIQIINAVDQKFDPSIHEAVGYEYSNEIEQNNVIRQWSVGFKYNSKLLKPALVIVSRGKQN